MSDQRLDDQGRAEGRLLMLTVDHLPAALRVGGLLIVALLVAILAVLAFAEAPTAATVVSVLGAIFGLAWLAGGGR